jgi:hypothetical protein
MAMFLVAVRNVPDTSEMFLIRFRLSPRIDDFYYLEWKIFSLAGNVQTIKNL